MNLMKELERLTMPAPKASKVRRLSADEIEGLLLAEEITPVDRIPQQHLCGTESEPRTLGRGHYAYGH